jgi:hypothetical protein
MSDKEHFCLQLAEVYADLCRNTDLQGWQVAKVLDAVAKKLYPPKDTTSCEESA